MRKRKISLGIVLLGTAIIIVLTLFISSIIGKALEKEVELLFPKLAAESNIGEVDFSFMRGVFIHDLDMQFLLEDGDTCKVNANKVRLGVDISELLFRKGKVRISRLKVDTLNVYLPTDFDSLNVIQIESDFKKVLRRFSRRDFITPGFSFASTQIKLKDLKNQNLIFNSFKIKKRGARDFYLSFVKGTYKEITELNYLKLQLKNYNLSSSAVISNDSLWFSVNDSLNFNQIIRNVNISTGKIREKINSLIKFEYFKLSCTSVNNGELISAKDVSLSLAGSEDLLNFGFNSNNLKYGKNELTSCSFNITSDEAGLISRDMKIFTEEQSFEASGKLSLKSADTSNVIFSLKGIDLEKVFQKLKIDNKFDISGDAIFNGVFKGVLNKSNTWNISANSRIKKFDFKVTKKLNNRKLSINMSADSLLLDSTHWENGELSGGCSIFTNDSIKYNTVFSIDKNENSLFVSRLYSIPISYGRERLKITTSAFSMKLDSVYNDSVFPVKEMSTEILRVENESKRRFNYKKYKSDLNKLLRSVTDCKINIRMLSVGKDSVSVLEAKNVSFIVKDSVNQKLNVASLKYPQKAELSGVKSSFYMDSTNVLRVKSIALSKMVLDTFDRSVLRINKNNVHVKLNNCLNKIEKFSSNNTKFDIRNVKINIDSTNELSVYRIKGNLSNVDSLYSSFTFSNIKLPESMDNKLGRSIKQIRAKYRQDGGKLFFEDFKLEADGSRYYSDGNINLIKNLPCSLSVNLENIKLFKHSRDFLKDSTVNIRGGAYSRFRFKGKLLKPKTWKGKGSILLKNLHVDGIPLQKIEIITKYAPPFSNVNFTDIDMNPIDLKPGGQLHIKSVHAKGKELNFTGWGSMDYKGRFYFEMNGKVKKRIANKLPNLTQLALNKGDNANYGNFYAKLYGSTKKQYLVPEKGIHGKVIRSKFRQMGASFRNLFN